jgi:hypothetical protein
MATDILNGGLMLEKSVPTTVNICFKVHGSVEFKRLDSVFVKKVTRDLCKERTCKGLLLENFRYLILGIRAMLTSCFL